MNSRDIAIEAAREKELNKYLDGNNWQKEEEIRERETDKKLDEMRGK